MATIRRLAWVVFLFFALLGTVFGVFPGGWFEEDADPEASFLIATFAGVAVVLTIAIAVTAFRRGETWAWWAFWVWPLFFIVHGFVVFPVDFVFAALGIAALAVTYPGHRSKGRA